MRTTDTAASLRDRSGAVPGMSNRAGDVDRAARRSTPATATTPGPRTSTTATRTTTTRTTSCASAPSADECGRDYCFQRLVEAYFDCRRTKRNSASALAFEANLERNLITLHEELNAGTWCPGRSICFVVTHPRPREVWAAEFRDRIVHHLLYNAIGARIESTFIADSCACIPGRGTLYAAERLEHHVRSVSHNWSRPAWYLKCDLANFFVAIDKRILAAQLEARIDHPWWRKLALTILWHDPRADHEYRGRADLLKRVPHHKRLTEQPAHCGLPIGNLSSQFYANVLLDSLDQHAKHIIRARRYVRYVDDFILLHESPTWLNAAHRAIEAHLPSIGVHLNPVKTILQPVARGIDFVGQVVKPWSRTIRRNTLQRALERVRTIDEADLHATANTYFGLIHQSNHGHHDAARLAKLLRMRGRAVDREFKKSFRSQ